MEFYDPDTARPSPEWATEAAEIDEPRSTMPRPIPEIVVLGIAVVLLIFYGVSIGRSGGLIVLQFGNVLSSALLIGAITSLFVRRVLRGHRQIQAEQVAALRDHLEALVRRIDDARA
ncbi:MAG TPA: hypothetical protein VK906_03265 [Egicoccus sp.]|nr:hypothetical protein [Egicoccus sp.]HSK22164.1 hypothetical protein [Egicoccus sp.]